MRFNIFPWRSLKTRVTLLTLSGFVIGIWLTAFYASRMLREDMQRLLGEQQFSTVSFAAADINQQLEDRLKALESIAGRITPAMMGDTVALQAYLEGRPVFQNLFNGGSFVTGRDGIATAAFPLVAERIGVNYAERDFMAAALKDGKAAIGKPVIGKVLGVPTFGMAMPIRNPQGEVMGALVGATNLGLPNFLDKISQNHYGQTGSYLLIAPKYRLIVTTSDKNRIMETLPAAGISPKLDRFINGYEGSDVFVNPVGVEVLNSAKSIPVAGWYLAATLPTEEAFAPIHEMQRRLLLAASLLTLLTGGLIWWILQRQLAPMLTAVKILAVLSKSDQPPQPLPITHQDEVGDLIGGFNRLLEALGKQREAMRQSEEHFQMLFREMQSGFAHSEIICDAQGRPVDSRYLAVNPAYERITGRSVETVVGKTLLEVFPALEPGWIEAFGRVALTGEPANFEMNAAELGISFAVSAFRPAPNQYACTFSDITKRKQAEAALNASEARSRAITESAYEAIITSDRAGNIAGWNRGAEIIFGYTEAQAMGQPMTLLMPERYREAHLAGLNRIRSGAELHLGGKTVELHGLRQDGGEFPLELTIARWESAEGWFVTAIIADISERKRDEAQLIKQLDELRRWQQMTLGREGRVAAVKKEVNALLAERGLPPRYTSVLDEEPVK